MAPAEAATTLVEKPTAPAEVAIPPVATAIASTAT